MDNNSSVFFPALQSDINDSINGREGYTTKSFFSNITSSIKESLCDNFLANAIKNNENVNKVANYKMPYISQAGSKLKDIFYGVSIFKALNHDVLAEEAKKNKNLSIIQKIELGLKAGTAGYISTLILSYGLHYATQGIREGTIAKNNEIQFLTTGILFPILEEIVYRGVLQNSVALIQETACHILRHISPIEMKNNKVFQWMTSPSARILAINSIFALAHLGIFNNVGIFIYNGSIKQATVIMSTPMESILHETTGDIIATIAAHIAHNTLCCLAMR